MNDPVISPASALDDRQSGFQQVFFSPATWPAGVEFYKVMTELTPNPAGPPTAVFKSETYEIWVTQTADKSILANQSADSPRLLAVISPEWVALAQRTAGTLGAEIVLPQTDITVYPIFNRPPKWRKLNMTIARFQSGQQATPDDTTVGAVHNPNW